MPKNIFKISRNSNTENSYIYSAEVDPSSHILKGHFVEMAVVPGVCTLTMIKECIADILGVDSVRYESIKECKFLATILPSEHKSILVNITLKEEGNILVEVTHEETKMMKLKAKISKQ